MKLRIKLRAGPALERRLARSRKVSSVVAELLTVAAVMALTLGVWRLGTDLKWAGEFFISRGLFSHWQVWIAFAGVLQICSTILGHYGRSGIPQSSAVEKRQPAGAERAASSPRV